MVQQVLPRARIVRLTSEVGEGGTISDYFAAVEKTQRDFEIVLAAASGITTGSGRAGDGNPDFPAEG